MYKFSVQSNGNHVWVLTTSEFGRTVEVHISNDVKGKPCAHKVEVYDEGQNYTVLPDDIYLEAVQQLIQEEDMDTEEAEAFMYEKEWVAQTMFYNIHGLDVGPIIKDALSTWQALNKIARFELWWVGEIGT